MRQHEAKDVQQLAAGQLIVCGVLSVAVLGWQARQDPVLANELNVDLITSVCFNAWRCCM
jgi:hypothetical protein